MKQRMKFFAFLVLSLMLFTTAIAAAIPLQLLFSSGNNNIVYVILCFPSIVLGIKVFCEIRKTSPGKLKNLFSFSLGILFLISTAMMSLTEVMILAEIDLLTENAFYALYCISYILAFFLSSDVSKYHQLDVIEATFFAMREKSLYEINENYFAIIIAILSLYYAVFQK